MHIFTVIMSIDLGVHVNVGMHYVKGVLQMIWSMSNVV